jgi:hypothetical protein
MPMHAREETTRITEKTLSGDMMGAKLAGGAHSKAAFHVEKELTALYAL